MAAPTGVRSYKKIKSDVPCRKCTLCCEWQHDQTIAPILEENEMQKFEHMKIINLGHSEEKTVIQMDVITGNCIYLIKGGCSIHHLRPKACQEYDCRKILQELLDQPNNYFTRLMVQAVKISGE